MDISQLIILKSQYYFYICHPNIMNQIYYNVQDVKRLISVDCVIFGYEKDQLKLLLFKRIIEPAKGKWSLIGGFINGDESAEDAARRVLTYITGLKDVYLEQVKAFSEPERDPGSRRRRHRIRRSL